MDNELDESETLKSAYKLLNYTELKNPIYIGPELSREELIKEREVFKLRRELITQGRDRKELRVRNLTLQERVEHKWRVYQTDVCLESASENPDKSLISLLFFNVQSVLDIERRMALSNALISSHFFYLWYSMACRNVAHLKRSCWSSFPERVWIAQGWSQQRGQNKAWSSHRCKAWAQPLSLED